MATYSLDNFIKIPVQGDRKLEISDSNGNIQYMLDPLDVNFFYRNYKLVIHQLRTKIERQPSRDHNYAELDFDSISIAQSAELKANDYKNILLSFVDYYTITEVDTLIENINSGLTTTFLDLLDTPDSYNLTGYTLTVNSGGTGIDFTLINQNIIRKIGEIDYNDINSSYNIIFSNAKLSNELFIRGYAKITIPFVSTESVLIENIIFVESGFDDSGFFPKKDLSDISVTIVPQDTAYTPTWTSGEMGIYIETQSYSTYIT